MADNEFAGSALYAIWVSTSPAGTVTLNTEFRNFTFTPSIDFIDATAGADTGRRRLSSFVDSTVKCTMLMQNDMGTVAVNQFAPGVTGTLTWGEAGTASGKIKVTLPAICQGMTRTAVYNDVVAIDVSWMQNGTIAYGAW